MREPFPYESDISSLQPILVPDPVSRNEWESACTFWESSGKSHSFLEWLLIEKVVPQQSLLTALADYCGANIVSSMDGITICESEPEVMLLQRFGFIAFKANSGQRWIAGGPDFPPDPKKYLGDQAKHYRWVLVSPIREPFPKAEKGDFNFHKSSARVSRSEEWLNQLIMTSRAERASDLYVERSDSHTRARIRTETGMRELGTWSEEHTAGALRLLKNWAGLSTARNPLPGDGHLSRRINNQTVSYRCSHIRTDKGESFALREVSGQAQERNMNALGLPHDLQEILGECIHWNPGFILFTGPTCSGKTTTQFSVVKEIRELGRKIMTIEDPVEYRMDGVIQSNVNVLSGWTFSRAIRAFLRQDPDWIVVGEIRDRESAHAACRAALTGHGVLATLHAKSSADAMNRLRAWGIPEGTLSEALRLIVNQRLDYSDNNKCLKASFSWQSCKLEEPIVASGVVKI